MAVTKDLTIDSTNKADGTVVITLGGELELHNCQQCREALSAELSRDDTRRVLVALDGLSFIDSSGLGVLVGGKKQADQAGREFALICGQAGLKRIFEIAGLTQVFTFFEDVTAACGGGEDEQ